MCISLPKESRSGGSVVDHTLDYQHRDHKIGPPLLWSFRLDFKPRSCLRMTSFLVGLLTRVHSLAHSKRITKIKIDLPLPYSVVCLSLLSMANLNEVFEVLKLLVCSAMKPTG